MLSSVKLSKELLGKRRVGDKVNFISQYKEGAIQQRRVIGGELPTEDVPLFFQIFQLSTTDIQNVQQEPGAFHVAQEGKPQAAVVVSPFDKTRDICKNDAVIVHRNDP